MIVIKIYSIIVLSIVDLVIYDNYIKSKDKNNLIAFISILPIIFYILLR